MVGNRSVTGMVSILSILLITGICTAQMSGTIRGVEEPVGTSGKVDWTTGLVTAVGIGAPPPHPDNPAQARGMAERVAQVVALRNLLESVRGVRVDSSTMVDNFIVSSDSVRTQVNGFVQGSTILDKKYLSDGSIEITVGLYIKGALLESLLPPQSAKPPVKYVPGAAPATPDGAYTGIIVDARGLGARPAMAPKILNEDGKEVYGSAWVSREYAVREGMAGYLKDPAAALTNPRVADKPLTVKALKVAGENRADLVISNADAATLHGMSQNLSFLEKCRVIILVD